MLRLLVHFILFMSNNVSCYSENILCCFLIWGTDKLLCTWRDYHWHPEIEELNKAYRHQKLGKKAARPLKASVMRSPGSVANLPQSPHRSILLSRSSLPNYWNVYECATRWPFCVELDCLLLANSRSSSLTWTNGLVGIIPVPPVRVRTRDRRKNTDVAHE